MTQDQKGAWISSKSQILLTWKVDPQLSLLISEAHPHDPPQGIWAGWVLTVSTGGPPAELNSLLGLSFRSVYFLF